jgi:hypothetical protein
MKRKTALAVLFVFLSSAVVHNQPLFKDSNQSSPFSQAQFVPDISLILDFSYKHSSNMDDGLVIPGFIDKESEDQSMINDGANPQYNGRFNLNYGEMTLYSVVDPYFDLFAVCHFTEEHAELEEGYLTTRSLPFGFQLKAGKFLSSFGRINEQHEHYWDFIDPPLANSVFFGDGLNEKGVRLTWIAPVNFYLMAGGEILEGENESSFGRNGFSDASHTIHVDDSRSPNLNVGYVKTSFDIGNWVLLGSLSGAFGKSRINNGLDDPGAEGNAVFSNTYILGSSLTVKYILDSFRHLNFQSEYLYRKMDGVQYSKTTSDELFREVLLKKQSGLYSQLVAKVSKRWRTGVRCDVLDANSLCLNAADVSLPRNMWKISCVVDYNPTEFSRLRVQYNLDKSRFAETTGGFNNKTIHELFFQINLAIGAHGAHSF